MDLLTAFREYRECNGDKIHEEDSYALGVMIKRLSIKNGKGLPIAGGSSRKVRLSLATLSL